jgi:hypothetical protein
MDLKMEYNSGRNRLVIPEYGRNIQKLIEYAIQLEDREERNKIARAIVDVMGQLNPQLRDITDFKHKLWDHLFIISDFKLDVDSPYDIPSELTYRIKPRKVDYPSHNIRFRHYGHIVEDMIAEISKIEDGNRKDQMVVNLANFMKMLYVNWNKDSVSDEVIFEHLRILSKGKLEVKSDTRLQHASEIPSVKVPVKKSRQRRSKGSNSKNYRKG